MNRFIMVSLLLLTFAGLINAQDVPGVNVTPRGPGDLDVKEDQYSKLREKVTIDQKLGDSVPLDAPLLEHDGTPTSLGKILAGGKPVLLVPAYYRCRQQCNVVLMGIFDALKRVKFKPGQDFQVVVFSFDDEETPEIAGIKREEMMQVTGRPLKANSALQGVYDHRTVAEWHFTVAGKPVIEEVCSSIGYQFERDPRNGEVLHPAGVVFLTPEGKISHYRMGMNYAPWDLEKDLQLASDNGIGGVVDKLAFVCMKYDPHSGRYSVHVMRLVQAGAALTIVLLGGFIFGNRFFAGRVKARRSDSLFSKAKPVTDLGGAN